jgi:hypothetical protein
MARNAHAGEPQSRRFGPVPDMALVRLPNGHISSRLGLIEAD